jgi:crotonobetainyl-CoA:carnitine CoA-transferase CaiB-like acyl-CoA transferase
MDGVMPFATLQLAYQWASPEPLTRGTHPLSGGLACYGVYPCASGGFMALAALEPKFWEVFCKGVGKDEWVARQFAPDAQDELKDALGELFAGRTREHWTVFGEEHECCLSPVLELGEVGENEHLRERGLVEGETPQTAHLGSPFRFCTDTLPPAPELGAHTHEILRGLEIEEKRVAELVRMGVIN